MRANLPDLMGTGSSQLNAMLISPEFLNDFRVFLAPLGEPMPVPTGWVGTPAPASPLPVRLLTSRISENIGGYGS